MTVTTFNYAEASVDELKARGQELRADFASLSEGERSDDESARARAIIREVDQLDVNLKLALDAAAVAPHAGVGTMAAHLTIPQMFEGARSGGQAVMEHAAMKAWIDGGMSSEPFAFALEGLSIDSFGLSGSRAAWPEYGAGGPPTGATGGVSGLLPVGQPIAPLPRRAMLFMRDLIPVQKTTLSQVPYVRELNPTTTEGGATAVAEGAVKPDAQPTFTSAVAYITVIAANVSPTKQLWEDAPVVAAYLNQRLPYLIKFREDAEILNGGGTFPDIQGLSGVAGHQTQAATASDFAITLGNAIAKVENVDGQATAVVMNPLDAWTMFIKRAAGGSGTFDAGIPFSMSPTDNLSVWGLPVKRSRAYAQGTALVGDFERGAMILDREEVNVQVFPQHSDYAARNQILVQAEERIGLAIFRPDEFVVATL